MNTNIKRFYENKEYTSRSVCDHNCIFYARVIKRTAKTVTVKIDGYDIMTKKIYIYDGFESFKMGNYSMAPIFRAK